MVAELKRHDELYYDLASPEISDYEYDQKAALVLDYERKNPEHVAKDSPTHRIWELPSQGFEQRSHRVPMLSLANTYSEEEVLHFVERVQKGIGSTKPPTLFCELKIDGVAISLFYRQGQLVHAITRGNGKVGDVVTANILTITSVPVVLKPPFPEEMEIRGEVYMPLATFRQLNLERQKEGLALLANPRNGAAGALKLLDPRVTKTRKLELFCYGLVSSDSFVRTQSEVYQALARWQLPILPMGYWGVAEEVEGVFRFVRKVGQERGQLPFEIDGIVVKVDNLAFQQELGVTGKTPRFAVAYKLAPERAKTTVLDLTLQVGRSGVITPVAELQPVELAGSVIRRATLHNRDEVQRKDIRIGDWVWIEKGGDVIPKVIEVDLTLRDASSRPWHMPNQCPVCHRPLAEQESQVAVRCVNRLCSGKRLARIRHFASKQAMNIDHLGPKVIEKLFDLDLVREPADLYILKEGDLENIDGFQTKSIHNLLNGIEASKTCDLATLIMALGIPHVGAQGAFHIAEEGGTLERLFEMTEEELMSIEGVGDKTAKSLCAYLLDREHRVEIERLISYGVVVRPHRKILKGDKFKGKTFVLTGTLVRYTRQEASKLIQSLGGVVVSEVGRHTDYVIVGEDPGSKLTKAKKLGIPILDESQWLSWLDAEA
jgi:DNA ligase (NAD+)